MERLSLHQLAAIHATPAELIDIAARLECPTVTLFATRGTKSSAPFVETRAQAGELRRQANSLGVGVHNLEVFSLDDQGVTDRIRSAVEIAAELGGKRFTACIYDTDLRRARDNFDQLHSLGVDHGLAVHIEFHAFGAIKTLPQTRAFLADGPAGAGICADVLHFYRNEGGLDSLLGPQSVPITHAQMCDGPLSRPQAEWVDEAVSDRRLPGQGAFDLVAFVRALPRDIRIDVETPTQARAAAGVSNLELCAAALAAARRVMAAADSGEQTPTPARMEGKS